VDSRQVDARQKRSEGLYGDLRLMELFPPYLGPKIALERLWRDFRGINERYSMEILIRHGEAGDFEAVRAISRGSDHIAVKSAICGF